MGHEVREGLRSADRAGFHQQCDGDGALTFEVRDAEEQVLWAIPQAK